VIEYSYFLSPCPDFVIYPIVSIYAVLSAYGHCVLDRRVYFLCAVGTLKPYVLGPSAWKGLMQLDASTELPDPTLCARRVLHEYQKQNMSWCSIFGLVQLPSNLSLG
jgi:hypothetical protein